MNDEAFDALMRSSLSRLNLRMREHEHVLCSSPLWRCEERERRAIEQVLRGVATTDICRAAIKAIQHEAHRAQFERGEPEKVK